MISELYRDLRGSTPYSLPPENLWREFKKFIENLSIKQI
jgi:hypothetical protein